MSRVSLTPRPSMVISRRALRPARRIAFVVCAGAVALIGCDSTTREGAEGSRMSTAPTPEAEFVVTAGDSTFWVRSGSRGVAVRASPILLARLDNRFYELYVTDDDRSFRDAVFVGQQLWKRDIVSNDSTLVWFDPTIPRLAEAWATAYPGDRPLAPDEPESEEPIASAVTELSVLDVVGPYISVEWLADLHPLGGLPSHQLRRAVLDLRSGELVPLASLVGADAAGHVAAAGRREFARLSDSLARAENDISSGSFSFDPTSFALGVDAGRPAIAFLAPARGDAAGDVGGLPLDPVPFAATAWWESVRGERASPTDSPHEGVWQSRPGVRLLARYDTADGQAELRLLTAPVPPVRTAAEAVEATGTAPREWPLVRVPPPLLRVYWLDRPSMSAADRRALRRAFDEADRYESDLPLPKLPGRLAAGPPSPVVLALAPR